MSQDIVFVEGESTEPESRWNGLQGRIALRTSVLELRLLSLLRYSALVIAVLTLVCAAALLAFGLFQQVGKTRVEPADVSVSVDDIAPPGTTSPGVTAPAGAPKKFAVGKELHDRTLQIYRERFQRFERPGTKIDPQAIVDLVWPQERFEAFSALGDGHLLDKEGHALKGGVAVASDSLAMVEAGVKEGSFDRRLIAYRDAKKVQVCAEKVVTRSREESYWDSFSTSCANWATSPIGCMSSRTIREPSIENVCEMKFPENIESPGQSLSNAVQRYQASAEEKLGRSRRAAIDQTMRNSDRKAEGQSNMLTGGQLFVGFLGIMFLYLLIALERHHRNLMKFVARG
jgi:hypothetical protein